MSAADSGLETGAVRYRTRMTAVGPLVPDFREQGLIIFFAEGAPEELHEFAVLHSPDVTSGGLRSGDTIAIDSWSAEILAVGDVADDNLVNLGHLDLKANGESTPALPGDVNVAVGPLPEIHAGSVMEIRRAREDS
jgi:glucitol/sorbitol PTS system EIIA component